jgi:hypothetical protein
MKKKDVPSAKITLSEIYVLYPFDTGKIAQQAGVESRLVHNLVVGHGSISKQNLVKVLAAISHYTGRNYTIDTVQVRCKVIDSEEDSR